MLHRAVLHPGPSRLQVIEQPGKKPHPKMIDLIVMPKPGTIKMPQAGEAETQEQQH